MTYIYIEKKTVALKFSNRTCLPLDILASSGQKTHAIKIYYPNTCEGTFETKILAIQFHFSASQAYTCWPIRLQLDSHEELRAREFGRFVIDSGNRSLALRSRARQLPESRVAIAAAKADGELRSQAADTEVTAPWARRRLCRATRRRVRRPRGRRRRPLAPTARSPPSRTYRISRRSYRGSRSRPRAR